VPPEFSIAEACCGRWASDPARIALYWEDEGGASAQYTFCDLDEQANRLANALAAMGVARGDKIALILPQRPETVVAHIAINRLGAVAVPLSFLFGPDALEYRLHNSETKVAFVDPQSLANMAAIRERCPGVAHIVGVAGARESWVTPWEKLQEKASPQFTPLASAAIDPAFLVYTSGTTGPPKGASMPQQCLIGNLPGFVHSHDGFPQPGDVFWSPADWAWTGGLMDALLPTMYFGRPIVGYRGRFDPERAFRAHREVRRPQHVPVSDRAQDDDEGRADASRAVRPQAALDHERRRSGRHHGVRLGARSARRDHQRDVRPDRDELHRGQLARAVARKAGLDGAALPRAPHRGHR
jgi:acetyl-CoA synthetase